MYKRQIIVRVELVDGRVIEIPHVDVGLDETIESIGDALDAQLAHGSLNLVYREDIVEDDLLRRPHYTRVIIPRASVFRIEVAEPESDPANYVICKSQSEPNIHYYDPSKGT